jgi:hypothetical protein
MFGGMNMNSSANPVASQSKPDSFGSFQSAPKKTDFGGLFDFEKMKQEQADLTKRQQEQKK